MLKFLKVSFLVLLVGGLTLGTIGCRKNKGVGEGTPDDFDIGMTHDMEISDGEWMDPAMLGSETADIYVTVYFELDQSTLRAETRQVLEGIADDLNAHPKRYVRAIGHCCDRGTNEYNFGLGERRAASVRAYLVALGIDGDRIRTLSKGEEEPAVPNTDESARSKNRRVEFKVVDK